MPIDNKPRSGLLSTARKDENVEEIQELVLAYTSLSIEQLSVIISWSSIQQILTEDMGIKQITAKFEPWAVMTSIKKNKN